MTREQIEKAADEYIGFAKEIDEGIDTTMRRRAFRDGAEWRIESVWHETDKKPITDEDLLLWLDSQDMVVPGTYNEYEDMYVLTTGYVLRDYNVGKWAYISDLTPEREEETE